MIVVAIVTNINANKPDMGWPAARTTVVFNAIKVKNGVQTKKQAIYVKNAQPVKSFMKLTVVNKPGQLANKQCLRSGKKQP